MNVGVATHYISTQLWMPRGVMQAERFRTRGHERLAEIWKHHVMKGTENCRVAEATFSERTGVKDVACGRTLACWWWITAEAQSGQAMDSLLFVSLEFAFDLLSATAVLMNWTAKQASARRSVRTTETAGRVPRDKSKGRGGYDESTLRKCSVAITLVHDS